jgi:hypothetical protein
VLSDWFSMAISFAANDQALREVTGSENFA